MKCLRCGVCCVTHMVVIVDDPEIGPRENNLIGKESNVRCQHLRGDKPPFTCAIHNKRWYSQTPCATHDQIPPDPELPCRLGEFALKSGFAKRVHERSQETPPAH